jgi:hypothetical protein
MHTYIQVSKCPLTYSCKYTGVVATLSPSLPLSPVYGSSDYVFGIIGTITAGTAGGVYAIKDRSRNTIIEVVFGDKGNTVSCFRDPGAKTCLETYTSTTPYTTYWLTWAGNVLTLGGGPTQGLNVFLRYSISGPVSSAEVMLPEGATQLQLALNTLLTMGCQTCPTQGLSDCTPVSPPLPFGRLYMDACRNAYHLLPDYRARSEAHQHVQNTAVCGYAQRRDSDYAHIHTNIHMHTHTGTLR